MHLILVPGVGLLHIYDLTVLVVDVGVAGGKPVGKVAGIQQLLIPLRRSRGVAGQRGGLFLPFPGAVHLQHRVGNVVVGADVHQSTFGLCLPGNQQHHGRHRRPNQQHPGENQNPEPFLFLFCHFHSLPFSFGFFLLNAKEELSAVYLLRPAETGVFRLFPIFTIPD